jgi:hypothetical protein
MCRSYAPLCVSPNQKHRARIPRHQEGRIAIVTNVGCGMRWTRQHRRRTVCADGEVVWFWHLDADAKLRGNDPRSDGDKKARSPGRARRKPLKPFAQGMPGRFRCACGDVARVFSLLHTRLRVQSVHPAFPVPSLSRDKLASPGRGSRRGKVEVCLGSGCRYKHCRHHRPCPGDPRFACFLRRQRRGWPGQARPSKVCFSKCLRS